MRYLLQYCRLYRRTCPMANFWHFVLFIHNMFLLQLDNSNNQGRIKYNKSSAKAILKDKIVINDIETLSGSYILSNYSAIAKNLYILNECRLFCTLLLESTYHWQCCYHHKKNHYTQKSIFFDTETVLGTTCYYKLIMK